ncbi:hypothetical protein QJS66_10855 [Kocuria rhizophila]|nr:hypothetical protein QJS66_10855 [Kocuria rhizophila]
MNTAALVQAAVARGRTRSWTWLLRGGAIPGNRRTCAPCTTTACSASCFLLAPVWTSPRLEADEMEEALAEIKTFDSLLIVHAEDSAPSTRPRSPTATSENFLKFPPRSAENIAIAEVMSTPLDRGPLRTSCTCPPRTRSP